MKAKVGFNIDKYKLNIYLNKDLKSPSSLMRLSSHYDLIEGFS